MGYNDSGCGPVTSFCEQGKEPSGFKIGGEFLDHLSIISAF